MGYYTRYNLTVENPSEELLFEIESDKSVFEYGYTWKNHFEDIDIQTDYKGKDHLVATVYSKWYDHEDDLSKISKRYPELTFILDGDGEEAGDVWRQFWRNGEMKEWHLSYERPSSMEECEPNGI